MEACSDAPPLTCPPFRTGFICPPLCFPTPPHISTSLPPAPNGPPARLPAPPPPQSDNDGTLEWSDVWAYVGKVHSGRWYSRPLVVCLKGAEVGAGGLYGAVERWALHVCMCVCVLVASKPSCAPRGLARQPRPSLPPTLVDAPRRPPPHATASSQQAVSNVLYTAVVVPRDAVTRMASRAKMSITSMRLGMSRSALGAASITAPSGPPDAAATAPFAAAAPPPASHAHAWRPSSALRKVAPMPAAAAAAAAPSPPSSAAEGESATRQAPSLQPAGDSLGAADSLAAGQQGGGLGGWVGVTARASRTGSPHAQPAAGGLVRAEADEAAHVSPWEPGQTVLA
jgi:hypothetical protein